jgi:hypothetical protein
MPQPVAIENTVKPNEPEDPPVEEERPKRKMCEPSNETIRVEKESKTLWKIHEACMSSLGLDHHKMAEQVRSMGDLLSKVSQDLSLENNDELQNETKMAEDIVAHQSKVEEDTSAIATKFNAQKEKCLLQEVAAKKKMAELKKEQANDHLYCKKMKLKAKLCRDENAKNMANVKKRHAEAKKRTALILSDSKRAAKLLLNNEVDSLNEQTDILVAGRQAHAMAAHKAAIGALKYLTFVETIYLRRQKRSELVSENPEDVCFPVEIIINATKKMTRLQETMRSLDRKAQRANTGANCLRENNKLKERSDDKVPCQSFEFFKGDPTVRMWFDPSKTKAKTMEMNAIIVNAPLLYQAANRTLYKEMAVSKKDAIALANAEEVARCKAHALGVAKRLDADQKAHMLRDEAFEAGDLCNADVRTVFMEFSAAHRLRSPSMQKNKMSKLLRLHAHEKRRRLLWRSEAIEKENDEGEKVLSFSCDTKFKCKAAFAASAKPGAEKMTCTVCTDQLYTGGFGAYGAADSTEKSVFEPNSGLNSPMNTIYSKFDYVNGYVNRLGRTDPGIADAEDPNKGCFDKADDDFKLPCCRPLKGPSGELIVVDPSKIVENPTSTPALEIAPFLSKNTDLACCGGGPACCRWCPELLCDSLEKLPENLPKLWHHVCANEDTNPSWESLKNPGE